MDKMREEFESAWAESRCDDDGVIGNKPTRSMINADCYSGGAAQFAWVWWQRSRSALCVELPSFENGCIRGYSGDCEEARMVVDAIAESLDEAGVRYE